MCRYEIFENVKNLIIIVNYIFINLSPVGIPSKNKLGFIFIIS